jgi:hypothetical protein
MCVLPADSRGVQSARKGLEAGLGIHAAVDQQVTFGELHQVNVDPAEKERKRQLDTLHTRKHFTRRIYKWSFRGQARC